MSANETLRTARRLRYRRLRRPVQKRGVSPVVATLILILIAVAAAAALYLWLVGWQGSVTGTIGKPGVNTGTFSIGGSTSVYPFSQLAVTQYLQNNTGATISLTQGGTGAGMLAVCAGSIDVGEASSVQTVAGLIGSDGCPSADVSSITITTVAYDAVDIAVQNANPHGLISIASSTMFYLYYEQSTTNPSSYVSAPTLFNGGVISGGAYNWAVTNESSAFNTSGHGYFQQLGFAWDNLPACVNTTALTTDTCGTTGVIETRIAGPNQNTLTEPTACGVETAGVYADICYSASSAGSGHYTSSCGWTVCAGPAPSSLALFTGNTTAGTTGKSTDPVITVQRSDTSGTTQAFTAKVFGFNGGTSPVTTFTGLATATKGCGSDGQLASCGIAATQGENGNPNVITYISGSKDAIGYASDGLMRSSTSGVTCQGVPTNGCGIAFEGIGQSAPVQPSLSSTGTIANGINDPTGTGSSINTEYAPWRPFEYVTLAPPTGLVASYIAWLLQPGVNTAISTEAAEVSIYSI